MGAVRLGASIGARWQGEALDRLLKAAHSGTVDAAVRLLATDGREVVPEATLSHFGERPFSRWVPRRHPGGDTRAAYCPPGTPNRQCPPASPPAHLPRPPASPPAHLPAGRALRRT